MLTFFAIILKSYPPAGGLNLKSSLIPKTQPSDYRPTDDIIKQIFRRV